MAAINHPATKFSMRPQHQGAGPAVEAYAVPSEPSALTEVAAAPAEVHLPDALHDGTGVHETDAQVSYRQQFEHAMAAIDLDSPGIFHTKCQENTAAFSPRGPSHSSPVSHCSTPPAHIASLVSPGFLANDASNTTVPHPQQHPGSMHSPRSPVTEPTSGAADHHSTSHSLQQPLQYGSSANTRAAGSVAMHENLPPELHPAVCEAPRSMGRHAHSTVGSLDNSQEGLRHRPQPGRHLASPHGNPDAQTVELQNKVVRADIGWTPPVELATAACSYRIASSGPHSADSPGPARAHRHMQHPDDPNPHMMHLNRAYASGGYRASWETHALQDSSNMPLRPVSPNSAPSAICAHVGALS